MATHPAASLPGLPNVLIQHMCEFLWWVEVVAVTATSRACRDKLAGSKLLDIRPIIRDQLILAMEGLASDADTILRLLDTSGNQMTGSFVLQAMYGGTACPWRDTVADIDVLVPPNTITQTSFPTYHADQLEYASPGGGYEHEPAHALVAWNTRRNAAMKLVDTPCRGRGGGGGRGRGRGGRRAGRSVCDSTPSPPPSLSFTHVGQETGRNIADEHCKDIRASYMYTSLANFVAREADFAFCHVGGTCAARACKRAGPFPPFTPQDVLSAARAAQIPKEHTWEMVCGL
jgi:hypothetical protein